MSLSQSDFSPAFADTSERRQRLVMLTCLLACCAVVASVGWGPAIAAVAQTLRPHQLDHLNNRYSNEVRAVVGEAELHMRIITIASFLVIVALAVMAILLGRKALRMRASDIVLSRLEKWAIGSLVGSLAIGVGPILLSVADRSFYLSTNMSILLVSIAIAGAVGSFILSGIAVRHTTALRTARICLVVASLMMLAGFVVVTGVAQFIVGFYLTIVF